MSIKASHKQSIHTPNLTNDYASGSSKLLPGKYPNDRDDGSPSRKKAQPNVTRTEGRMVVPLVDCYSTVALSIPTVASLNHSLSNPDILFQEVSIHVAVAVDLQPPFDDIDSPVFLQFKILDIETSPTNTPHPYQHTKTKVIVDSEDERVYPGYYCPRYTPAAEPTVAQTRVHGHETKVIWEYDVRDPNQQQGMTVEVGKLPFVEFWPESRAQVQKPFRIELSSYWSTRMPKKGSKFLPASWKRQPMPLLRNFCHVTCITLPSDLSTRARLKLQLNACIPPLTKEDSAIFTLHKLPSSDLDEVTVNGNVELLDSIRIDSGGRRISRLLQFWR